eukprot:CAMPEP_0197393322 /NCGR_PEP_ID=MMETSP1165-20131217/4253_1 /TAXON_ID=284809 /ORGANISM="Chrysocystis fragilis, Strain CCMP3189" /LENGTH=194 /DNA_ID=CAMNT_0042918985 /DNA_START=276 /DNA_END=857 /DNA_ORIENTATION=+
MESPSQEQVLDVEETPDTIFSASTETPGDQGKVATSSDEDDDEEKESPDAKWEARFARLEGHFNEARAMTQDIKQDIRDSVVKNKENEKRIKTLETEVEYCKHFNTTNEKLIDSLTNRTSQLQQELPETQTTLQHHDKRLQLVEEFQKLGMNPANPSTAPDVLQQAIASQSRTLFEQTQSNRELNETFGQFSQD